MVTLYARAEGVQWVRWVVNDDRLRGIHGPLSLFGGSGVPLSSSSLPQEALVFTRGLIAGVCGGS